MTVDHEVNEEWIIYKIWFLNPKFQNVQLLSMDLNKSLFDKISVWPLIWWLFWWWIVFWVLMLLYSKWQIWQVLFRLNVIWGWILLLFYGWKIFKFLYNKYFKTRRVEYGWLSINYDKHSDALMLSSEIVNLLKKLKKNFWIAKFCCTWNCVYLFQDICDHEWNKLSSSSKLYSEQEKANLQQRTMDYIRQLEFLSLFSLN